ncbi:MAG TPA: hypothetical protein VFA07_03115 [Chthonomonadaceae bacterium]|nr:hypothetical protein [Chthonomonadaceae bacterium]
MNLYRTHAVLCLALAALAALALPTSAQQSASVSVNAGTGLGAIPTQAFGVNTAVWDGYLLDSSIPSLMTSAGVTVLRYPGGSTSDVYHWQTNSATAGTGQYINPNDTFDNFMSVVNAMGGTAVITVNYGSNAAGTGGGDPNEAAGWVNYANNTKHYGVKYWEVGNEIYGNGEYGASWEEDLHSSHTPTTYGANVVTFANAMKAQDSTIKVGAVLCAPGNWPDGVSPDWNSNVLAQCGTSIDFVIVHWYPQGPGGESDSGLLGDPSQIAGMVSKLRSLINQYCGSNAPNVQILVTETNSVSSNPGKQTVSLVNALFCADDYMTWLENGVTSVDWWDLHNGPNTGGNNSSSLYGSATYGDYGILASGGSGEPSADTPLASYYGLQMLKDLGKPGDTMVSSSSNASLITAHAVKQANGNLALLLVDKDPNNAYNVSISVSGYTPASSATTYTYGKSSSAISSSSISNAGTSFTYTVQPYSLNTIVMTAGSAGGNPTFTASATVSPSTVAAGGSTTITTKVTDTSGTLSNGIVDVEVYNSAGTKVSQTYWTGQNFSTNQQQTYTWNYTVPTTTGTYTIKIGVFNSTWGTNYYWNSGAATLTVVSADSAQYNFESGTQGWTVSGGMLTGVNTATSPVYAGAQSLAVNFNGSKSDTQQAYVGSPSTPAGKTVTFHVWIPSGSAITAVQPYVQQGASGGWTWTGNYQAISNLKTNAWNTITVTVPSNAVTPLYQLGVQFFTNAAWKGACYVDSISW